MTLTHDSIPNTANLDRRAALFELERRRERIAAMERQLGGPIDDDDEARNDRLSLAGLALRYAALVVLDSDRRSLTVSQVREGIEALGFNVCRPQPNKRLADALATEVRRRRARRVARGVYEIGYLPRTTRMRAKERLALLRSAAASAEDELGDLVELLGRAGGVDEEGGHG